MGVAPAVVGDLASFVRMMPSAIALTRRADGRFVEVSPAYEAIVGKTRDELIGHTVIELGILRADDRESMRKLWDSAAAPQEMTITRPDGTVRSAIVQGIATFARDEPAYLVVLTDITERVQLEATTREERAMHAALLAALSDAGEAICVVDMEAQRAVYLNDALCKMYGMPPGSMPSANMYDRIPPDERVRLAEVAKARAPGEPAPSTSQLVILRDDGARLPVEVVSQRLTLGGRPHMLTIVRDLTRQREAEAAMRSNVVTRSFARRLLTGVIERARVSEDVVREVGRQLASESATPSLDDSLGAYRAMGLGTLRLEKAEGKAFTFHGADLIEMRPGSSQCTCYLALSYLEGCVAKKHGTQALGSETRCRSRGDDACVFVVVAR